MTTTELGQHGRKLADAVTAGDWRKALEEAGVLTQGVGEVIDGVLNPDQSAPEGAAAAAGELAAVGEDIISACDQAEKAPQPAAALGAAGIDIDTILAVIAVARKVGELIAKIRAR